MNKLQIIDFDGVMVPNVLKTVDKSKITKAQFAKLIKQHQYQILNPDMIQLIKYWKQNGYTIWFVTGRIEKLSGKFTKKLLKIYGIDVKLLSEIGWKNPNEDLLIMYPEYLSFEDSVYFNWKKEEIFPQLETFDEVQVQDDDQKLLAFLNEEANKLDISEQKRLMLHYYECISIDIISHRDVKLIRGFS